MSGERYQFECAGGAMQINEPEEWAMLRFATCWQHAPTRTVFEVVVDPNAGPDTIMRAEVLRARLTHVCDTHPVPSEDDLRRLGQEAIVMCLQEVGIVTLHAEH